MCPHPFSHLIMVKIFENCFHEIIPEMIWIIHEIICELAELIGELICKLI
jgi:hypothetical protein